MRLTIIGAGPGGYETALKAARSGIQTTIISDGPVGGTCLNEGCIPTKSFCRNAQVLEELRKASVFGIDSMTYSFDFQQVLLRKEAVVSQLRGGVEFLLGNKLIRLIHGKASFKDASTVIVNGEEITSDYIVIATGSVSVLLPIPGNDLDGVVTSREMLNLQEVPKRLCVIGAGVIGLEFASIFKSFGTQVSVVEYCKDILPRFDIDLAKRLKQALVKRGISIETAAGVQSIVSTSEGLEVSYIQQDQPHTIVADKVLMAVGRRANVASLNLSDAGIAFTPKGIPVNEYMQTNVPNIYAVGDIQGRMMLAHVATFQGERALNHILAGQPSSGSVDKIDLSIVPAAVFTDPEAATVGMTEEECKDKGIDYRCLKSFFRANGKAVAMDETDGYCKLIISSEGGRLLGCHIFGAHASDLIQEVTALMDSGADISDYQAIIHAHPTLGEVVQSAVKS